MAKGNDGNYFQHSVEIALANELAGATPSGDLHIALAHGMAPFEPCDQPRSGQSLNLLRGALNASYLPKTSGEPLIVSAYRATNATFRHYPNSAELLRYVVGTEHLSGGITEVDSAKYVELAEAWRGSHVQVVNASWRSQLGNQSALSCPPSLMKPWLLTLDPMTYRQEGDADDNNVYYPDVDRLSAVIQRFVQSERPGAAVLFVYAVKPDDRACFWDFLDELAAHSGATLTTYWHTHQGGNRNLAGLLHSGFRLANSFPPAGITPGRD